MKLDVGIMGAISTDGGGQIVDAGGRAKEMEDAGYSGVISAETSHDPFLPLALAAVRTERIDLMTGIAVAFARNPMSIAMVAWDLQQLSQGRFVLGLGSQIRPHITKRFSMPWSSPAARMEEMIEAVRAIWACWQDGAKLDFRGEYYRHTLMTPMFDPGPTEYGPPPITLAAVGPMMTKVAGRAADGFVSHAFQTADYLRDVTIPNLEEGMAESGRARADFEISMPVFIVSSFDEADAAKQARSVKKQVAFYGSTPAYRPVLEHHGWGDAQGELNRLSKQGQWNEMADVIDDEMLDAFAVVADPPDVPTQLAKRFGGTLDRVQAYSRIDTDERWRPILDEIKLL